jgi:molybdopterin molybdotransferase
MIILEKAQKIITTKIKADLQQSITIATDKTLGYLSAVPQYTKIDQPPFDRATMDGYAILANDKSASFQILEMLAAGKISKTKIKTGTAIKIMTGAKMPSGVLRVIPKENTKEKNGLMKVIKWPHKDNIARQGEDSKNGALVLKAGSKINPVAIANLIATGNDKIAVHPQLKVAILATGDEIVSSFRALTPGKIINSNSPMLSALLQQHGFNVSSNTVVKDNKEATKKAILKAQAKADCIILSGGVSAGDLDFVAEALENANFKIHFNRVAIKPGLPTTFATRNNKIAFGLPGNPVAVYLTFHLMVLPALYAKLGCAFQHSYLTLPLTESIELRSSQRVSFLPATLQKDGSVMPLPFHGSGHLTALLKSDGFIVIPKNQCKIKAKQKVTFLLL